jgi:hypothetical protein
MKKITVAFLAAILLSPACLFAAGAPSIKFQQKGTWGIIPMVAYYHFDNARKLQSSGGAGLGVSYFLTPNWSAELDAIFIGTYQTKGQKKSVNGQYYNADGYYYFYANYPLQPYLNAGVGASHFNRKMVNTPSTQFAINIGGGLMYYVDKHIALRAGVINYMNTTGAFRNDFGVNAGVAILFGGGSDNSADDNADENTVSASSGVVVLPTESTADETQAQQKVGANERTQIVEKEMAEQQKQAQAATHVSAEKAKSSATKPKPQKDAQTATSQSLYGE